MKILLNFSRSYFWQTLGTLGVLIVAGIVEGLSLSALLPLLNLANLNMETGASGQAGPSDSGPGKFVEQLLSGMGIEPSVGGLLLVIVFGVLLKNGLLLWGKKRVGYTVAQIATDLRLALVRSLLATRWEYFVRQPVGQLANSIGTEITRASRTYLHGVNGIAILIQSIVYAVVACLVSFGATVVSLGVSLVILYALNSLVRMAWRAGKRQTKVLKSLSRHLADSLQSVKAFKSMAREYLLGEILEKETQRLDKALKKEVMSTAYLDSAREPIVTILIAAFLYVSLIHWGLQLSSVMVLTLLLSNLLGRLGKLQGQYQKVRSLESAYYSICETIDSAKKEKEQEHIGELQRPKFIEHLKMNEVTFGYRKGPVIRKMNLTVPAGSITVIMGPSGAGKTTVVDLVIGLISPQDGEVTIDGIALPHIDLRTWRGMIGYVPQDTLLLHDTILRNVTFGASDFTEKDAERALRASGAWEFIQSLPQGMETSVGERGLGLSGGQRQRIAIARALIHHPTLLILDEATSALDPKNEAALCSTLEQLHGQLTILAVSHQTAITTIADYVYRLENGKATLISGDFCQPQQTK